MTEPRSNSPRPAPLSIFDVVEHLVAVLGKELVEDLAFVDTPDLVYRLLTDPYGPNRLQDRQLRTALDLIELMRPRSSDREIRSWFTSEIELLGGFTPVATIVAGPNPRLFTAALAFAAAPAESAPSSDDDPEPDVGDPE